MMGWDFKSRKRLALFCAVLSVSVVATVVYQNSNFYGFGRIADFASNLLSLGEEIPLQTSCLSRNQSSSFRRPSPYQMSPYLLSKIHAYEDLHRRCGPNTGPYNQTLRYLLESSYHVNVNSSSNPTTQCRYAVWSPKAGLGNRMMTLVSSFLYALLTDRVLLVDFGLDMGELFCEPFLNTSWILPKKFPYREDTILNLQEIMKRKQDNSSVAASLPSFLRVDVKNGVGDDIELFHCDEGQSVLNKVPIVVIRSDLYFAPLLYITPSFIPELNKMFPLKETIFHHLGHYLLKPSDAAWELIMKYYHAYNFHKADVKVGLQIRVVNDEIVPPRVVMDQILRCTQKNDIFPMSSNKAKDSLSMKSMNTTTLKVVFVTSLFPDYAKGLRALYSGRPTSAGEMIEVYQPSSDGYQKMGNRKQNMEAWAEMYLLSLSDLLVTTGESTFGYVAQALGSLKPWVLRKQDEHTASLPACYRALTIDACSHFRPHYDCKTKGYTEHITDLFPQVKACEDRLWWGIRLSDGH